MSSQRQNFFNNSLLNIWWWHYHYYTRKSCLIYVGISNLVEEVKIIEARAGGFWKWGLLIAQDSRFDLILIIINNADEPETPSLPNSPSLDSSGILGTRPPIQYIPIYQSYGFNHFESGKLTWDSVFAEHLLSCWVNNICPSGISIIKAAAAVSHRASLGSPSSSGLKCGIWRVDCCQHN